MDNAVENLVEALELEKAVYSDLLALAVKQRDALVRRDTEALASITESQTRKLSQAHRLDSVAGDATRALASALGLEAAGATVRDLCGRLNTPAAERMRGLREEIGTAADRLALLNEINMELFETALASVRFTFSLIAGSEEPAGYPMPDAVRPARSLAIDHQA